MKLTCCLLLGMILSSPLIIFSQSYTQNIRGTIVEKVLQIPIAGATVKIEGTQLGGVSDVNGHFQIEHVPLGTHTLKVSAMGYKETTLSNMQINAGKELVLTVSLEERIIQGKDIVIKTGRIKNRPLNELSMVSARSFTVEETQKYAASVNDPARMVTNFPGVASADDGNNQIIIRGNAPTGLLWRMEGLDIPNPNHFASAGSSGGGISILSTQLMANSDFVTGAFAAEYGNALSGVFDLKLRKGNNEHREYTLQAGILGLNLAAEGPFSKNYKGSYLINYRYSTLSILSALGLNFTPSTTNFQDLSYHIVLPTREMGTFSLFSLGGLSHQFYHAPADSLKWKSSSDQYSDQFISNTGLWAITHKIGVGKKGLLNSAIGYSLTKNAYDRSFTQHDYVTLPMYKQSYLTRRVNTNIAFTYRFSPRLMWRSGLMANYILFDFSESQRELASLPMHEMIKAKQHTQTYQVYSQGQWKPSEKFILSGGIHYLFLAYNQTYAIEPRVSAKWDFHSNQSISFGYGRHSQLQSWGVYFTQQFDSLNRMTLPNRNLGFSKADHWVLSYQYSINPYLRLKTELYYQHLHHVPVSRFDTSSFSVLNVQADYIREPLINLGRGRNYGIEISLEKYLHRNFYYTLSTSFYQSHYTAVNGQWYNTKYNGNSILNLIAGKDFVSKNQRRTLGLSLKSVYAGGYRTTPIDLDKSQAEGKTIYIQEKAFTDKLPAYFRSDIRISMKWNRKRLTSTLSLDIQNVSNRQNVYDQYFDVESAKVKTYYQTGIIPILNYKVEF
ncbi:MAG: TonB-dependent receptor [Chitinophagaceae bacterium]|nr:TonB-dependent receptor [Chitinophagaceae bacterium]